jgi:hypothetical protein
LCARADRAHNRLIWADFRHFGRAKPHPSLKRRLGRSLAFPEMSLF